MVADGGGARPASGGAEEGTATRQSTAGEEQVARGRDGGGEARHPGADAGQAQPQPLPRVVAEQQGAEQEQRREEVEEHGHPTGTSTVSSSCSNSETSRVRSISQSPGALRSAPGMT